MRLLWFLLALCGAALAGAHAAGTAPERPEPTEPSVSLPRGAPLAETLAALHRATGSPVLCEVPLVERRLEAELAAVPLPKALEEVSRSFQLHGIRRGDTLAFLRRYADPREECDLEIEELAAALADLTRLIQPAFPHDPSWSTRLTADQRDFFRALTTEQRQTMRTGRLPFASLPKSQQTLWLRINATQGYANTAMEIRRVARMFAAWKQGAVAYLTIPVLIPGGGGAVEQQTSLYFHWPDPHPEFAGQVPRLQLPDPADPASFPPRRAPTVSGVTRPEAPDRRPASFKKRLEGLKAGEFGLPELVAAVEKATGNQIRIPAGARGRRLLVHAGGSPAGAVISALEDLYGWQLRHEQERRYVLGRPRLAAAKNGLDLHEKLRAALPPALQLVLGSESVDQGRFPRYARLYARVMGEITRIKGKGWKRAPTSDMDASLQRRLAHLLFEYRALGPVGKIAKQPTPFWWLVAPEQGYFALQDAPGQTPLVMFQVSRPDGKTDGWGWYVGSSSTGD